MKINELPQNRYAAALSAPSLSPALSCRYNGTVITAPSRNTTLNACAQLSHSQKYSTLCSLDGSAATGMRTLKTLP